MSASEPETPEPDTRQAPPWHVRTAAEVIERLEADAEHGLTRREAKRRLVRYGPNEIESRRRRGPLQLFFSQFTDFMILVLIAAAVVSGIVGDPVDTIAIVVIVVLNGVVGFVQEYRAERAVAALQRMAAPTARVRRRDKLQDIAATKLVPGDWVVLKAGDVMPADLRLCQAAGLEVDESALTGESEAITKTDAPLEEPDAPLGERHNMGYKGTLVTGGRGEGVVVATGMDSELGRIATLLHEETSGRTPLQRRLARFGQRLALSVLAICALIFVAGLLRGEPAVLMFLTAVSLAVAAIPEALPAVVTVSLALGARKMARQKALIRRLPAVETLGSVTVICADKTGTLTQNRMHLEGYYAEGARHADLGDRQQHPWDLLAQALALNNDTRLDSEGRATGTATEIALARAAQEAGLEREALEREWPRIGELPFDAERKRMTTVHRTDGEVITLVKGAPEAVIAQCDDILTREGAQPLDPEPVLEAAGELAGEGYRVLAFAFRRWPQMPEPLTPAHAETGLTFLGLAALIDPPRPEAEQAVGLCRSAGIVPVMITGDHPDTARAIGERLGIARPGDRVITGQELAAGTGAASETGLRAPVYARVSPEQKIDIVGALQDQGQFVAMTGDGVNDAPALRRADIGVAMGQKGTDVAREAADMVLLDDNFATIVAAVRAGRRIYDNIRKFVKYTMTSNAGEIWTLFLAPFLGLPIPLLPIHILWINLVTDGLPGLALAVEPEEPGVMQRRPRPPGESLFARGMWQHILWVGLLIGGLSILSQALALHQGSEHWQTMVFTVLTFSQLVHVLAIRSERQSLFRLGLWSNPAVLGAVVLTFALQLATIYVPWLNPVFKTDPLTAWELGFCLVVPWTVLLAVELEKWLFRRGWIYQAQEHEAVEVRHP